MDLMPPFTGPIPDSFAAIKGWRSWHVDDEGRLFSPSYGLVEPWPEYAPLVAVCHAGTEGAEVTDVDHAVPGEGCNCGIHAATSVLGAIENGADRSLRDPLRRRPVLGQVSLWGRVAPGTFGWRGKLAYPAVIYLSPAQWSLRDAIVARYGIAVERAEALGELAALAYTQEQERAHSLGRTQGMLLTGPMAPVVVSWFLPGAPLATLFMSALLTAGLLYAAWPLLKSNLRHAQRRDVGATLLAGGLGLLMAGLLVLAPLAALQAVGPVPDVRIDLPHPY